MTDRYSWGGSADYVAPAAERLYDDRKTYYAAASEAVRTNRSSMYSWEDDPLVCDAIYSIMISIDTSGSMQKWPGLFFKKAVLTCEQAEKYFPGCMISYQAINDYYSDGSHNAFQPGPFAAGPDVDAVLANLYAVGGGGPGITESYEICAAYNSKIETPNAERKPLCFILGDEKPFEFLPPEVAKHFELNHQDESKTPSKEVFALLHEKCDVFLIRKPYPGNDKEIEKAWIDIGLMKPQNIIMVEDADRVVDVLLGIFGSLTGREDEANAELIARQENDKGGDKKIETVMRSLDPYRSSISE